MATSPRAVGNPAPPSWNSPVAAVLAVLTFVGECTLLLGDAFRRVWKKPREVQETLNQMAFIGVASVPIVVLTTFASGAVLSLYSAELLVRYGAANLAGAAIGLAVTREIAPVLTGIMVAARAGSAMAAQIGTMAVSEQVDALKSLNVHPTNYLVLPRIIASVTMLPILALVGVYGGVLGGYSVSVFVAGVPDGAFWQSIRQFVEPADFVKGMVKTVAFGLIVSVVACQQGLRTKEGAVGVGRATTNTVVITMVLIYVANYFLTAIFYTGR
ncbi:MAG: ABC transporter permease [Fimbriimonadaceae bacterium]|nr:ABC transporter permease [Fimbriimonadaceae bacterium]QYK56848.1 MAG: ABC transporter permease [Fimbriimonadaceae bacterium]